MLVSAFGGIARGGRVEVGQGGGDLERVDVLVPSLASQEGFGRAARDSLNLAFTNQRSAATRGALRRDEEREREREKERERERTTDVEAE